MNQHQRIISCMKALGYSSNAGGICAGLAQMAKRAILLDELDVFNERIKKITHLSVSFFEMLARELRKEKSQRNLGFLMKKNITENDVIDILAFFDGIELYINRNKHLSLFQSIRCLSRQDDRLIHSLVSTDVLAVSGGRRRRIFFRCL